MKRNKNFLYYLYCALGEKSGKTDKDADKVAFIRLLMFLSILITNVFIVYGVLKTHHFSKTMKYQVIYKENKKQQVATFYKIEDAFLWEKHVGKQGCTNIEIVPVF